jgi:hypothetical protein
VTHDFQCLAQISPCAFGMALTLLALVDACDELIPCSADVLQAALVVPAQFLCAPQNSLSVADLFVFGEQAARVSCDKVSPTFSSPA